MGEKYKCFVVILTLLFTVGGSADRAFALAQNGGSDICDLKAASLVYNRTPYEKIWKGQTVTWTVISDPSGRESELTISPGTLSGTTISYLCSESSASASTPVTATAVGCMEPTLSAPGPVVFRLVSAKVIPEVICKNESAQIVYQCSPDNSGPIPVFSGDNVDAAGFIGGGGTIMAVGDHTYTVTGGDTTMTVKLTVVTGVAGDWTQIHTVVAPADTTTYYNVHGTYWLQDINVALNLWARGNLTRQNELIDGDSEVVGGCNDKVSYSKTKKFGITLSGGIPEYLTAEITAEIEHRVEHELGPTPNKRYKFKPRFVRRTIIDTRMWMVQFPSSSEWLMLTGEQGGQGTFTVATFLLDFVDYDEWAGCCQ